MSNQRKDGLVCSIRINSIDAMAIADLVQATEQYRLNMNFSEAVSCALRTLLTWAKSNKIVPERSGFEYSDVMKHYANKRNTWGRHALADKPVELTVPITPTAAASTPQVISKENAHLLIRVLKAKGRENWTQQDDMDWVVAFSTINPDQPMEYPA